MTSATALAFLTSPLATGTRRQNYKKSEILALFIRLHSTQLRSIANQPEELVDGREGNGGAFDRAVGGEGSVGIGPTVGVRQVRVLLERKRFVERRPGKSHVAAGANVGKGGPLARKSV